MIKIWGIFAFFCFLTSCKRENKTAPLSTAAMRVYALHNPNRATVVDDLEKYNRFDGQSIGIGGVESMQFKRLRILKTFSEDSLLKLTAHKNPVVRAYAFNALVEKNSRHAKKVFINSIADTTRFLEMNGCIGLTTSINLFYYNHIAASLTDKERILLKEKVHSYHGTHNKRSGIFP